MPTRFDDLPTEIQLQIFETAARSQLTPRVVEVYFKEGQIYSKTKPPPLLHVCQRSRHVILSFYKPWLPRFRETAAHEPWERKLGNKDVRKLSRLQNVCINLEHDVLLINDKQWSPWDFGHIERAYLRNLAVNLGGWAGWLNSREFYTQFAHLKRLVIFDQRGDSKALSLKLGIVKKALAQAQKATRNDKSKKRYAAPHVRYCRPISAAVEWNGPVDEWITYRWPKGYKSVFRHTGRLRESELVEDFETVVNEPQPPRRGRGRPRREDVLLRSSQQAAKRGHAEVETDSLPSNSKRPRGRPRKAPVSKDLEEGQIPRRERLTRQSAAEAFARIRGCIDTFRTLPPEAESAREPSFSPGPTAAFRSPLHKYEFLRELLEESPERQPWSPEASQEVASSPRPLNSGIAFRGFFEESVDRAGIQQITPPPSSPLLGHSPTFQNFFDTSGSGSDLDGGVRDIDDSEVVQDSKDLSQELEKHCPASEQVSLDGLITARDNDNNISETETAVFEGCDLLFEESEHPPPHSTITEDEEYTPMQFMAERKTAEGLEFLVQWQDYPEEKDWTWETEAAMLDCAPDMVKAWLTKNEDEVEEENSVTVDYTVERILGKRKFKGVLHYLVKWDGFEETKDRTWEPCERLMIDVLLVVEAFEEKKRKK